MNAACPGKPQKKAIVGPLCLIRAYEEIRVSSNSQNSCFTQKRELAKQIANSPWTCCNLTNKILRWRQEVGSKRRNFLSRQGYALMRSAWCWKPGAYVFTQQICSKAGGVNGAKTVADSAQSIITRCGVNPCSTAGTSRCTGKCRRNTTYGQNGACGRAV